MYFKTVKEVSIILKIKALYTYRLDKIKITMCTFRTDEARTQTDSRFILSPFASAHAAPKLLSLDCHNTTTMTLFNTKDLV